ncbi:MAG: hypothetical protein LBD99_03845, partial [Candidatus Margulisbacteria bacterium]|nr:hypothetical protein [Candidatus Margulisiibacteriota bacterium]
NAYNNYFADEAVRLTAYLEKTHHLHLAKTRTDSAIFVSNLLKILDDRNRPEDLIIVNTSDPYNYSWSLSPNFWGIKTYSEAELEKFGSLKSILFTRKNGQYRPNINLSKNALRRIIDYFGKNDIAIRVSRNELYYDFITLQEEFKPYVQLLNALENLCRAVRLITVTEIERYFRLYEAERPAG